MYCENCNCNSCKNIDPNTLYENDGKYTRKVVGRMWRSLAEKSEIKLD